MDRRKRKGDKRNIDPSNKVKRCLFGKPDFQERAAENKKQEEHFRRQMEEMKEKYNFDFNNDDPLQLANARYVDWEVVRTINNSGDDLSGCSVESASKIFNENTPPGSAGRAERGLSQLSNENHGNDETQELRTNDESNDYERNLRNSNNESRRES